MRILGTIASSSREVPGAPTIGTATDVGTARAYNNGAASVTFTAPTFDGGLPITSYTVTSSPGGFTGTGASSPITVTGLASSTSYTFTVTASNSRGTGAASAASNSITATTVPQAPTIGTATAGSGSATVTYTAGATGGAAVSVYTATSSPGSLTGTGASPITVSGLTNGTAYTFTVTATNANGTSAASSASNSVTPNLTNFYEVIVPTASGPGGVTAIRFDSSGNMYSSAYYAQSGHPTMSVALKQTATGAITWQKGLSNNYANDVSTGIGFDTSGNVYITGLLNTNPGKVTGLLAKYNSSGTLQWQKRLSDYNGTNVSSTYPRLFVDSSNVVWVFGECSYGGSGNLTGFLTRFDTSGNITNQYQTGELTRINRFVLDSSSNRYWTGYIFLTSNSQIYSFLTKYDSSNNRTWLKPYTGQYNSSSGTYRYTNMQNILTDSSSNVYGTGQIENSSGVYGGVVVKLNSSGVIQWQRQLTLSGGSIAGWSSVVDSSGNVYSLLSRQSPQTTFLTKHNSSGTLQWQRSFTNLNVYNDVPSITLSNDQNTVYFGGMTTTNQRPFIVRYPVDGSITGTYVASTNTTVIAASTLTDAAGQLRDDSTPNFTFSTGIYPTSANGSMTDVTLTATASITGL